MNPLEAPSVDSTVPFTLRHDLRPGELGALVALHGNVYAQECGFDSTFEAHVARLLGEFVPAQTESDRLWIAEWQGRLAGSIAIVSHSERDAQLCWFLVEPPARSLGLGKRLLHEAIAFCRCRQYEYIFLRSFQVLAAAARLFRSVGFAKVEERRSACWGVAAVEEWYVLHPLWGRHRVEARSASDGSGGTRRWRSGLV